MQQNSLYFIPGFAATNLVWKYQVADLEDKYLIVNSDEELNKHDQLVIIAWSMGVYKAIDLYFSMKEKVKGLVLVSPSPCFAKRDDYPFGQPLSVIRNLERKIKTDSKKGLDFFYSLVFNGGPHPIPHSLSYSEKEHLLSDLAFLKQIDIRNKLNEIKIPVLIVHGEADTICSIEGAIYMTKKIEKSKLITFQGGHAPFLENIKEFNQALKDFLEDVFGQ